MKVDIFNTDKKYQIIYADPPWIFKVWSDKAQRNVADHYPVMKVEDIKRIPVQDMAADNAVLCVWATFPNLKYALEVIEAWGFEYKTVAFTWVKKNKKVDSLFWGNGYYTRSNAEICLLATKGKPLARLSRSVHSVILSRVQEHSKKPDIIREKIVEFSGDIPRIELFARQYADGWDCWGNEV